MSTPPPVKDDWIADLESCPTACRLVQNILPSENIAWRGGPWHPAALKGLSSRWAPVVSERVHCKNPVH